MKKILSAFVIAAWLPLTAFSQQAFVVKDIKVNGLQNIDRLTVESYLPIKRGQRLSADKTGKIVKSLYKTSFFDRISLSKQGDTLIINVVERPTIGRMKISGNSLIPTDKLTQAMKNLDIAEGRVYNQGLVERVKKSLLNQYYQLGHYNARVDVNTQKLSHNRVAIIIDISEGLTARVKGINIIGNHAFTEAELIKQLTLSNSGLFTFYTQTDRFADDKLQLSIESLRNYYLDHGYLQAQITSMQTQLTPDRKFVYLTFVVKEGEPYTIKFIDIKGQLAVTKAELMNLITIKAGDTFSRQKVMDSEKAITKLLGDKGYMFATISVQPTMDDQKRQVGITLNVSAGNRTYVRQITFTDNLRTNDVVLRRELTQMEAAPVSIAKLEESKQKLSLLPYIKDVNMSVNPVTDKNDQVDIDYKVKEDSASQLSFTAGYSGNNGALLGASLNQKNFLGSGNALGVNVQKSRIEQFYGIDYTNPYFTPDGISRSLSFSLSRIDPGNNDNVSSAYTTNEFDLGLVFGIPVGQIEGQYNRIVAGAIYQNTMIHLLKNVSNQVTSFVQDHGRHFQELDLRVGFTHDSRDRAIFTTVGNKQSLFVDGFAPLDKRSLSFYTLNYHGMWWQPIISDFIALTRADFGYGNGIHGASDYPFFRNFFAGGIDSVRGYQTFTLGPRDSTGDIDHPGRAYGGNMLVDASIAVIFPNHLSDNLRTSLFVDAGNVYSSMNNRKFGGTSTNSGPLRYSFGLQLDWLTMFGPINLVFAKPIKARKGDDTNFFDFAIGANF